MRIIVGSIVGNEKDNYLTEWLANVKSYADLHIVVNDASTDGTKKILEESGASVASNKQSMFLKDEAYLREMLWERIRGVAEEGDWIFIIDADEFYDHSKEEIIKACSGEVAAIKLCDMWSKDEYRIDGLWSPLIHRLFKFKDIDWGFLPERGLHLSPTPRYVHQASEVNVSNLRCRHMAYAKDADKKKKYEFYMANVEEGINRNHAKTIVNVPELKGYSSIMPRILITSLVHNREWILPAFLKCLENIDYPKDRVQFCFIVNNNTDRSLEILKEWNDKALILDYNFDRESATEHNWSIDLLYHMAIMRNQTLKIAEKLDVEYMINIDSDILFPPGVIKHLINADKKIISPVFWARWNADKKLPQVWERGGYEISPGALQSLKTKKGIFKVGGLGAFTCINRDVWEAGVNYSRVDNLPSNMQGEDRDFCVRARVHGFELRASNYFNLVHIDDEEMLAEFKTMSSLMGVGK